MLDHHLEHRCIIHNRGVPHRIADAAVSHHMTNLTSTTYESPVGTLTLVASEQGLRAVIWPGERAPRVGLAETPLQQGSTHVLEAACAQLDEYFAGARTQFDLPLDLQGTPFQVAAWRALAEIPYGETSS